MTLFGDRVFKGNQIKVRSSGWALIPYDWCPLKGGDWDTDQNTGRNHVKMETETPVMHPQAKQKQRLPGNHQKLGERPGTALRRNQCCQRHDL